MLDNNAPSTIFIEDMEIGMVRSRVKTITDRDITLFAEVSTDHNPVHLNDDYARDTMFQGRIAHGMLTASLISAVVGEQLPETAMMRSTFGSAGKLARPAIPPAAASAASTPRLLCTVTTSVCFASRPCASACVARSVRISSPSSTSPRSPP